MKLGLGTASFGTSIPESKAHVILDNYIEAGGRIVDTANNYAFWVGKGGESERVIGNWLSEEKRKLVQIHTKIGAQPLDGKDLRNVEGLSNLAIDAAIKASLNRLGTDYIDVLYAHIDDETTPLLETWRALSALVRSGVVKKLGISNYSVERVVELGNLIKTHGLTPINYAQYRHSAIEPIATADFGVQVCLDSKLITALKKVNPNILLVAYSPLLDGAFEPGAALPTNYASDANRDRVEELRREASQRGVTPSALVLKKIEEQGILPLTMTSKIERLAQNMRLFATNNQ